MVVQRHLSGVVLAVALLVTAVACSGDENEPDTRVPASPSTSSPSATPSTPAETDPPAEEKSPKQRAKQLATQQAKAYAEVSDRLYARPDIELSLLDDFAEDQALGEIKTSIQSRRDRGERISGTTQITKSWLGEEGVVFSNKSPKAVVDLYVCYDLGRPQVISADGGSRPLISEDVPRVAQARYAVYAKTWPNDDPSAWRVGKEFAAGEPCSR